MMFSLNIRLAILACLAFSSFLYAQALSDGRLLVQVPSNIVTCGSATVQWVWTGSAYDEMTHDIAIAVVQADSDDSSDSATFKRNVDEAQLHDHKRTIKRRSMSKMQRLQKRRMAVRIAGGSNIPMSVQSWTWSSVALVPGTYQLAVTILNTGVTVMSDVFTVSTGNNTTCLGGASYQSTELPDSTSTAPSTSSTDESTNTMATNTQTDATASQNSSTSTPATSNSSAATSPIPSDSQQQSQANTDQGNHGSNNGGKIAAGILVPTLAIGAVIAFFYFCRKRKINESAEHRQAWSEKAITLLNRASSKRDPAHVRNISQPTNPIHSAGLTQHNADIRNEMIEAREGCTLEPTSQGNTEHWVDLAADTDARPITPDHMQDIVRISMSQSRDEPMNTSIASSRAESSSTSHSTLPPYLREVRSPAPSFGQDANGQPLIASAARPSEDERRSSQTSTQMHDLSRNGSVTSNATVTVGRKDSTRDLTRNNSKNSVRRKPVPRISVSPDKLETVQSSAAVVSDEHGPFADDKEVSSSPQIDSSRQVTATTLQAAPPIQSHLSVVSGQTIYNDQLRDMLDGDAEILRTPRHSNTSDFPESVHPSPMSAQGSSPNLDAGSRVPILSSSRLRFESSHDDVPVNENATAEQREAWKLSVQLQDQDRGFRVSFPSEREG